VCQLFLCFMPVLELETIGRIHTMKNIEVRFSWSQTKVNIMEIRVLHVFPFLIEITCKRGDGSNLKLALYFATTMSSSYSAFFSSGLLAPYHDSSRAITPPPQAPSQMDTITPSSPNATTKNQPRLRRRRSSLTVSHSPFPGVKSPQRNARQALMSPTTSRSRSNTLGAANAVNLMGRLALRSANLQSRLGLKQVSLFSPPQGLFFSYLDLTE
jgi:hypothetical protein